MSARSALAGLRRHWRAGTLAQRLLARKRALSVEDKVRWLGASSEDEAARALAHRARREREAGSLDARVLVVGEGGDLAQALARELTRAGVPHRLLALGELETLAEAEAAKVGLILCAYPDGQRQTRTAIALAEHPTLAHKPFEHAAGLDPANAAFRRLDEYADTDFVSPVLLDSPSPYEIYLESLQRFEQKCGLRDYLDLYQVLRWIVTAGVPGDVAEFGSFRGHSGWLIARSLEALGDDRRVFLFDTFDSFPAERYGVDHFWSATHPVSFEAVRAEFADRPSVTLVKGDFTETLADSGIERLALAYIDCDSYRATRYLLETVPQGYLASRGALVCEDYGHPALLGNRAAVHQSLDGKKNLFPFFSQFSGLYIFLKVD